MRHPRLVRSRHAPGAFPTGLFVAGVVLVTLLGAVAALGCVGDIDCGFNACLATNFCGADGLCHSTPKNCADDDPCTIDDCQPAGVGCTHAPLCEDEDSLVCNGTERCLIVVVPGTGAHVGICRHTALSCDDGDACTNDSCLEPTGCQHTPRQDCDDGNRCTTDSCNAATGCQHTTIPGCCQTAIDCGTDACTIRLCTSGTCGSAMPVSCDDGNPLTVDACTPPAGCTHTPAGIVTTTVPPDHGGSCTDASDCPAPADACVAPACDDAHRCGSQAIDGFDSLACICRRADPAACDGQSVPHAVLRRRAHACTLIARAAHGGRRGRRLVGRVTRLLASAERRLSNARSVSPECRQADAALLADDAARAASVRKQL